MTHDQRESSTGLFRQVLSTREGEFDGADYDFLSQEAFKDLQETGGLLEHADYQGHLYGTRRHETEVLLASGMDLVCVLDVDGCLALQRALPGDVVSVQIQSPSHQHLWARMEARGDSESAIKAWMDQDCTLEASDRHFAVCTYRVLNDVLDMAVSDVRNILRRARDVRVDPLVRPLGLDALVAVTEACGT